MLAVTYSKFVRVYCSFPRIAKEYNRYVLKLNKECKIARRSYTTPEVSCFTCDLQDCINPNPDPRITFVLYQLP